MGEYVCCTTSEFLIACAASKWSGLPGRCRWCDEELAGRRSRWCSEQCSYDFAANHYWQQASRAAKKRDGQRCVDCGGLSPFEAYELAKENGAALHIARRRFTLEVHHLVPVLGRHAVNGCHHHQDGLVTVCLMHHVWRHRLLRDQGEQLQVA